MAKRRYHSRKSIKLGGQLSQQLGRPVTPYIFAVLFFLTVLACYDFYNMQLKWVVMTLMAIALVLAILRFAALRKRFTLPLCALTLYVLVDLFATLYAAQTASGKLALYAFLIVLAAFCLALVLTALAPGEGQTPGRWMSTVLSGFAGAASLVSIDLLSTRILSAPVMAYLRLITTAYEDYEGLNAGTRMTSVFGNPNVFAGVAGLGALLALGLAATEEKRGKRWAYVILLYLNSLAFLLVFSMGGTSMIVPAFLVFLFLERKERRMGTLVLMLETLVLAMVSAALISMTSMTEWTEIRPIPLLCAVVGAAALCALDELVGKKLADRLAVRAKLIPIVIPAAIIVLAVYLAAALNLTGGTTLQSGESLRRAAYPDPGEYTLTLETDNELTVTIQSQNREQVMLSTSTTLYRGPAADASFAVPEDSIVVYFNFYTNEASKIDSAVYAGDTGSGSVPLGYKLLPGFIANRLQGLFASGSVIQRLMWFEDGMKIFRSSPMIGVGMSGYENSFRSVQSLWSVTQNIHNHYIEVMVDKGIVGLVVFLTLLGSATAAVWFERHRGAESDPLLPALGAALVFMACHGAVEVVFSAYQYLPIAFGIFAIIGISCGPALPLPRLTKKVRTALASIPLILLGAVGVLLTGNMFAQSLVISNATLSSLKNAVSMDMFEWEDYALSYVVGTANSEADTAIREQAERYAQRLEKLDSITSAYHLAAYYFQTNRPEQGLAMVEKYVDFVASDRSKWQESFDLLRQFDNGTEQYQDGVLRIIQMLDTWNTENLGSIALDKNAQAYVDAVNMNVTIPAALSTPQLSSVTADAYYSVTVDWGPVDGAALYRVFYKAGSGLWTKIADTDATSYTWTGAEAGTNYTFTVSCLTENGGYASSYDKVGMSATTPAALSTPQLSSVIANSAFCVTIDWGSVSGTAQYRVYYKTGSGNWVGIANTGSTSFTWMGAEADTTYTFMVRCLTEDGRYYASSFDGIGMSTTTPAAALAPPPLSSATANSCHSVTIDWGSVSGADLYRVFYKTDSGNWVGIANTDSTSYTWTGAEASTTYTFMVRCVTGDGRYYTSEYDTVGISVTTPAE